MKQAIPGERQAMIELNGKHYSKNLAESKMTGWRSTLHHPDNDHWHEWREAVNRTGYNMALANASRALQELESFTPAAFESFTANLYRDLAA
jgi:hypothetical protein